MAKYTDEQIKKALELCVNWEAEYCEKCPFDDECGNDGDTPLRNALDLINRQESEIERLKQDLKITTKNYVEGGKIIRSEAIKEFAERLKSKAVTHNCRFNGAVYDITAVKVEDIDNLVKEMVGE